MDNCSLSLFRTLGDSLALRMNWIGTRGLPGPPGRPAPRLSGVVWLSGALTRLGVSGLGAPSPSSELKRGKEARGRLGVRMSRPEMPEIEDETVERAEEKVRYRLAAEREEDVSAMGDVLRSVTRLGV